jgi:hypothetical protein
MIFKQSHREWKSKYMHHGVSWRIERIHHRMLDRAVLIDFNHMAATTAQSGHSLNHQFYVPTRISLMIKHGSKTSRCMVQEWRSHPRARDGPCASA